MTSSLRKLIAKAVKTAFVAVGDIKRPATLFLGFDGEYDPDSNSMGTQFAHEVTLDAIPTTLELSGAGGVVSVKDGFVIQVASLPEGVDMKPGEVKPNSDFMEVDGIRYTIYQVVPDPAGATYTLLTRTA